MVVAPLVTNGDTWAWFLTFCLSRAAQPGRRGKSSQVIGQNFEPFDKASCKFYFARLSLAFCS